MNRKHTKPVLPVVAEICIIGILIALCEVFFFRNVLINGLMFGDRGDGRLTMLLTEHWWNFFRGQERFKELAFFYPSTEAIGYTDMLLGYGIVHSFFRLIGFDIFRAYKRTLMVVHLMGSVSAYDLLRRRLGVHPVWAMFGTVALSFQVTYANLLLHTQLAAISFLPVLMLFLVGFFREFEHRWKRNLYAYLFLSGFVLLTYNSWYVAYFAGLFLLVFMIVYLIRLKGIRPEGYAELWRGIRRIGIDWIGYVVYTVLLFLPFLQIYLPIMKRSSGFDFTDVTSYLPEPFDVFMQSDSLLFSPFMEWIEMPERSAGSELSTGFSFVLLICFLIALGRTLKKKQKESAYAVLTAFAVSIPVCILLCLKLNSDGVSLWMLIYHLVPGAASIRAVARFLFWLSCPMALVTALLLNRLHPLEKWTEEAGQASEGIRRPQVWRWIFSLALLALLSLSGISTNGTFARWDAREERQFLDNVPQPPADVEIFYADSIVASEEAEDNVRKNLDAYEIAEHYDLKTMNGYSGQFPEGWGGLFWMGTEDYEHCAYDLIDQYDLSHVYCYIIETGEWRPVTGD